MGPRGRTSRQVSCRCIQRQERAWCPSQLSRGNHRLSTKARSAPSSAAGSCPKQLTRCLERLGSPVRVKDCCPASPQRRHRPARWSRLFLRMRWKCQRHIRKRWFVCCTCSCKLLVQLLFHPIRVAIPGRCRPLRRWSSSFRWSPSILLGRDAAARPQRRVASPLLKSSVRSRGSSIPIESRNRPSEIPTAARSSADKLR